jgi:hypothetical protein
MRLPLRVLLVPPAFALVIGSAGCASVAKPGASSARGAAEPPPDRTNVEVQFIPDPGRIAPTLREGQGFTSPSPIVTHLPDYPAGLEKAGSAVVVLRFIVGVDGAVRDVGDSPLRDPGAAADPAFREAAVTAVRSWLFVPAEIRTVKPGADLDHDGKPDYTVLVESERVPVYLDVRFTFEMIAGQGRVRID